VSAPENPPAFPRPASTLSAYQYHGCQQGMTLRDYLAGQALTGLLANPVTYAWQDANTAGRAYHLADAMLQERVK
jgi:hypothetical protein